MKIALTILCTLVIVVSNGQPRNFSTGPDYKKEISDLTDLIKKFPDSINYYINRAALVYRLNLTYPKQMQSELKMKDVLPDLDKVISLQPNNAALYEKRGEYKWSINQDTSGALKDKSKAIELEPVNPVWLEKRGDFYILLKDYEKGCLDYTKGVELGSEACEKMKQIMCQ